MWAWFNTYSVWVFILVSCILILLLFLRKRVIEKLVKVTPEKMQRRTHIDIKIVFWVAEGVLFLIAFAALIAIVLSREGVKSIITPESIQRWFLEHGTSIFLIILVAMGLWYLWEKSVPLILRRYMTRPKRGESREGTKRRAETLQGIFLGVGKVAIILFVTFMVLSELDITIGPILAGFGIAGIAVGFGAQYLIRDMIAGVFILFENQYRVGDVARVADITGLVEEITMRKTVLRDLDGIVHHVPNGEIKVASNYSRHFARVNLNVSVGYGTDLDQAIAVINRVCSEFAADEDWRGKIRTVPQVLRVDKLGDSGIDIKILGEVKPLEQWAIMGELRLRLKKTFDAEGIEIPWPHTKVYFGNSPWEKEGK